MDDSHFEEPLRGARILIVEDDREIADVLDAFFSKEGAHRRIARDGDVAAAAISEFMPDLVVLDIKLPKRDGWSVLAELRKRSPRLPVIILSALGDDLDKLMGFRLGCDDYMVKPFNPLEVLARAHAVLRRGAPESPRDPVLRAAGLRIDTEAFQATLDESILDLTPTEFRMLKLLVERRGRLVTRGQLAEVALGDEVYDRSVNPHISRLRQKMESAGGGVELTSVRGEGYRLESQS